MANRDDLEKLCQGPKIWNAWREDQRGYIPDLRNANLTLSQRQLGPSNGGPINLEDADLEGAELRNATLTGANLSNARLTGADLSHSRLDGVNLISADLTNACFDHTDLTGADLTGAVLIGASLTGAKGVTAEQLAAAYGDASTRLPGDIPPPESWFPVFEDDDFTHEYPIPEPEKETDLYEVLGLAKGASSDDIRAAFRNLVKKLHPDINPGDAAAQEEFKQVSSAYRILNDPDKRARYDRGEIGTDGEVTAEYEAKRHFRRYAFRFYVAAAASLLMAIGVVGSLWYSVLTDKDSGRGRVELVVTQPKNMERLISGIAQTVPPELSEENQAAGLDTADERRGLEASAGSPRALPPANAGAASSSTAINDAQGDDQRPIIPTAAKTETPGHKEGPAANNADGRKAIKQQAAKGQSDGPPQPSGPEQSDAVGRADEAGETPADPSQPGQAATNAKQIASLSEDKPQGSSATEHPVEPSGSNGAADTSSPPSVIESKAPPGEPIGRSGHQPTSMRRRMETIALFGKDIKKSRPHRHQVTRPVQRRYHTNHHPPLTKPARTRQALAQRQKSQRRAALKSAASSCAKRKGAEASAIRSRICSAAGRSNERSRTAERNRRPASKTAHLRTRPEIRKKSGTFTRTQYPSRIKAKRTHGRKLLRRQKPHVRLQPCPLLSFLLR
ncbi:MAG: DnaJ domain-containing protein [Rhodomicrobium sp.]|nr:DnaJ domain-containing protein [Rhodomicrobium sp.]